MYKQRKRGVFFSTLLVLIFFGKIGTQAIIYIRFGLI